MRFNAPPNWPTPPQGWTPPPNWRPDPSWPSPPQGWQLWLHENEPADGGQAQSRAPRRENKGIPLLLVLALLLILGLAAGQAAVGGFLSLAGLLSLLLGSWAIVRGRLRFARIRGRRGGAAVLGAGLLLTIIGAVVQPAAPDTTRASSLQGAAPAPSPRQAFPTPSQEHPATSSSSAATAAPTATPTPTPTATRSATPKATATSTSSPQPTAAGSSPTREAAGPAAAAGRPGTALAALQALPIRGRAPKTGYDRQQFGHAWADVDRNGCDTRNDVLRRDLTAYVLKAGTNGCLVLRGTLHDPYTGQTIRFVRGQTTSSEVQVDHVVSLSDAWQKGAQAWNAAKREKFANDSLNLLAVDGPTNASKGDGDAATWLPPVRSYRCAYVARQVAVKRKYGLSMTRAEHSTTARILTRCPSRRLPQADRFVLGGGPVEAVAKPKPVRTAEPERAEAPPSTGASSGSDPNMGTCRAAKAAGYGPYYEGKDVEYGWYRDADHDGMVCE